MGRGHGLPGQKSEGIASVGPTLRGISQVAVGARCARYKSSPQRAGRSRRESCQPRQLCRSRRRHAIQGGSDGTRSCGNEQTCTCGSSRGGWPSSAALPQYSHTQREVAMHDDCARGVVPRAGPCTSGMVLLLVRPPQSSRSREFLSLVCRVCLAELVWY